MCILMKDFSDNLVLPIIVAIAMILGYRLDSLTLKYLKKRVALQPKVLEIKRIKIGQRTRIQLDKNEFEDSNVNLN